jgi:plasmid stabilization system protein ParE
MDRYRVIITPHAGKDLNEIHKHISGDSRQDAATAIRLILDALEPLKMFPHRTQIPRQRKGLKHPVRSLAVASFVVYFRVLDDQAVVRF